MSITLEVHPGDGGRDAETFAVELADAVSRHTSRPVEADGRVMRLHRL